MLGKKLKLYLDTCCLCRPFDNHDQEKILKETETILLILDLVSLGYFELVGSEAIQIEIEKIPDETKKGRVGRLLSLAGDRSQFTEHIKRRALDFHQKGLNGFDAFHLAFAEDTRVDVFLSTDDLLVKKAQSLSLGFEIHNPVSWWKQNWEKR